MLVEKRKNVFPARQNNYFPNPIKDNFSKHRFLVFLDKNIKKIKNFYPKKYFVFLKTFNGKK